MAVSTLLVVVLAALAGAEVEQATNAREDRVSFAGGRISFVPPEGFTPLTPAEMQLKFPAVNAPRAAVGNPKRTTTIAYDVLGQEIAASQLDEARKAMEAAYNQGVRGLKWMANDVRQVAGHEWAYLEFSAAAADQDIHNIVLLGVLDHHPVVFNFNSTVAEFPQVEALLRRSMSTITYVP